VEKTLAELAQIFGGKVVGDGAIKIKGLASISDAQEGHITFQQAYPMLRKDISPFLLIQNIVPNSQKPGHRHLLPRR